MSELSDIDLALSEAKRVAESLMTWQNRAEGRDSVRSSQWTIERGIAALEKLRREIRDGRKHIDPPDEPRHDEPHAANLTAADDGCQLCDTCEGAGVGMQMVCYGGAPVEQTTKCPDCDGEGQIAARRI